MRRTCATVRAELPALAAGTLPRWRRWAVTTHVRRCEACQEELVRERAVVARLAELGAPEVLTQVEPPRDLLDDLLHRAAEPTVRERLAVPARGAVSGARPALSLALVVIGAVVATTAGWATVRASRAVRRRVGHGGPDDAG